MPENHTPLDTASPIPWTADDLFPFIPAAFDDASDLSPTEKVVLFHACRRASRPAGTFNESVPNCAKHLNISARSVRRSLARLVETNRLAPEFQSGKETAYRILPPSQWHTPAKNGRGDKNAPGDKSDKGPRPKSTETPAKNDAPYKVKNEGVPSKGEGPARGAPAKLEYKREFEDQIKELDRKANRIALDPESWEDGELTDEAKRLILEIEARAHELDEQKCGVILPRPKSRTATAQPPACLRPARQLQPATIGGPDLGTTAAPGTPEYEDWKRRLFG